MRKRNKKAKEIAEKYVLPPRFSGYYRTVGKIAEVKVVVPSDSPTQRAPDLSNKSRIYLVPNWSGQIKMARIYSARFAEMDVDFDHACDLFPNNEEPHVHEISYFHDCPQRSSKARPLSDKEKEELSRLLEEVAIFREEKIIFPEEKRRTPRNALQAFLNQYSIESLKKLNKREPEYYEPERSEMWLFRSDGCAVRCVGQFRVQIFCPGDVEERHDFKSLGELLSMTIPGTDKTLRQAMANAPKEEFEYDV